MNDTTKKTLGRWSGKAIVSAILTLTALAGMAPRSFASPTEDILSRYFGSISISDLKLGGTVASGANGSAASTTTVMMQLFYEGTATAAYVTIGASSVAFYAPAGVLDTTMGTGANIYGAGAYDIAAATMSTLGQLCDAINTQGVQSGLPRYNCTLVGGVRSDSAQNFLPNVVQASGVNNLKAVGGYQVPTSTQALISLGIIPGQNRHVVLNYCAANSAGTPVVQVFGVPVKFGSSLGLFGATLTDANLVWQSPALVANTTTNEPVATVVSTPWVEFAPVSGNSYSYLNPPVGSLQYNGHVVVRANNYATGAAANASTNFIACSWYER